MKLLIISPLTTTIPSEYYAPIENHLYYVAKELQKRSHEVAIASLNGSRVPEGCILVAVQDKDEERAFNIAKPMLGQFDAIMDFSNLKYSYVYKHDEDPELKLVGPCYPPQAFSYQTSPPIPFPCFIATSDAMAQAMSSKLGCVFKVVPYFPSPPPPDFQVPERGDRILFLGRFEKQKGVQEAVDLARQMRMGLDVAGEDVVAISDQRFTVLLLQKADGRLIKIFGRVNESLKHELLAKAKAVVLPYLEDSVAWTGQVALEALQYGTPVVAMDKGCLKEIIKNGINGFLCEELEQLPQVVNRIGEINSELCVESAKKFSLEKAIDKYESLLQALVNEGYQW